MTLYATYDGEVLRPDEPLDLDKGARVRLTVEPSEEEAAPYSAFDLAAALRLDGPPDWSEHIHEYLTGEREHDD